MTSPVRLGVSPAAASTLTGVFNQRFEALFPCAGALGGASVLLPLRSSWFICVQTWGLGVCQPPPCGELAAAWLAPFHNLPPRWVHQLPPCRKSSLHWLPVSALLLVWMNVSSLSPWWSIFHTVQFFCQFWLFFVFKFLLSFFWLYKEAQCVYLCLHVGRKPRLIFLNVYFSPKFST